MPLADIRSTIAADVAAVVNPCGGNVHTYQRWAVEWSRLLALFRGDGDRVHAWMVSRSATQVERDNFPTIRRLHRMTLTGIYGLRDEDATELTWQDLIEDVCTALDNDPTLGDTVLTSGPAQVVRVDARMFGKVLCHYAELTLEAHERRI